MNFELANSQTSSIRNMHFLSKGSRIVDVQQSTRSKTFFIFISLLLSSKYSNNFEEKTFIFLARLHVIIVGVNKMRLSSARLLSN